MQVGVSSIDMEAKAIADNQLTVLVGDVKRFDVRDCPASVQQDGSRAQCAYGGGVMRNVVILMR
ncbi:MAG TPA: hypothetical protein VGQ41_14445 [Pyrinomonadaceae bacterium]|nr:hypothetical protein [Pyrinomonadaceae bacterium]